MSSWAVPFETCCIITHQFYWCAIEVLHSGSTITGHESTVVDVRMKNSTPWKSGKADGKACPSANGLYSIHFLVLVCCFPYCRLAFFSFRFWESNSSLMFLRTKPQTSEPAHRLSHPFYSCLLHSTSCTEPHIARVCSIKATVCESELNLILEEVVHIIPCGLHKQQRPYTVLVLAYYGHINTIFQGKQQPFISLCYTSVASLESIS